jgi:hypothetical protein
LGEEPLQSLLYYWVEGEPIPRGMDEEALLQRVKEKKEAAEQAAQQS